MPGVAQVGERRRAVRASRASCPSSPSSRPWWMYSGGSAPSARMSAGLQLRVRAVVGAADHVRDLEVEVVDGGRELVRRRAVGAQERRLAEAQRALGVGLADQVRGLAVAHVRARSAAPAPRPRRRPSHSRSATIASAPPSTLRAASVSSIRSRSDPPCSSAKRRFATALSALPRCSEPGRARCEAHASHVRTLQPGGIEVSAVAERR